jgi:hypothetical protein
MDPEEEQMLTYIVLIGLFVAAVGGVVGLMIWIF